MTTAAMHPLSVDDDAFIRAPRPLVYRRLTDVAGWPRWWAGMQVDAHHTDDGRESFALSWRGSRRRQVRLMVSLLDFRHDLGVAMDLRGDVAGRAEYWFEDVAGGVTVHHLCDGRTAAKVLPTLVAYRQMIRQGFFGLKDVVQTEVRTAVGQTP